MRSIIAGTTLLVAAIGGFSALGTSPAAAREYPWCARTSASGFNPSCSFTSYEQCMATVSGQRGDCLQNPILSFREQREPRRRNGRVMRQQQDDDWGNPRW